MSIQIIPQSNQIILKTNSVSGVYGMTPLAKGSFGTVWECKAQDPSCSMDRLVVKKLKSSLLSQENLDQTRNQAFAKECTILRQIREVPRTVRFISGLETTTPLLGEPDQVVKRYILMERVPGKSLYDRLSSTKTRLQTFSFEKLLYIAHSLLQTLAALEEKRIVHRDIKAENAILGEGDTLTLIDFGLAETLTGQMRQVRHRGTLAFMPPEVLENQMLAENLFPLIDVWNAGLMFLQMALGLGETRIALRKYNPNLFIDQETRSTQEYLELAEGQEAFISHCLAKKLNLSASDPLAEPVRVLFQGMLAPITQRDHAQTLLNKLYIAHPQMAPRISTDKDPSKTEKPSTSSSSGRPLSYPYIS